MSEPLLNTIAKPSISPIQRWNEYNTTGGKYYNGTVGMGGDFVCSSCYAKPKDLMQQQFSWEQYSKFGVGAGVQQDYRQSTQQGSSNSIFDTAQSRFSPANQSQNINF